jgi:LysR family transcriptional regulator, regulator for genes of the gallate degradation pathway
MSYSSLGIIPLSLRHLKAVRCVSKYKNVSKAADYLNRSQTAITHAINDVETALGFALFNRSSKGMSLTVFGDTPCRRFAGTLQQSRIV